MRNREETEVGAALTFLTLEQPDGSQASSKASLIQLDYLKTTKNLIQWTRLYSLP